MTTYDFFISHTQRDPEAKVIALELYSGFEKLGKSCWLDVKMPKRDMDAMKEGVRESKCFLAIVTNNGKDSYLSREMCRQEIMWAIEAKKPIVPVADMLDKPRFNEFISEARQYNFDLSKLNFCSISRESPQFISASLNQIIEQSAMPFKSEVLISTESHVRGLSELLASINLSDHLVDAQKWCEREGAESVEDLAGYETQFVEHLNLKSIPKRKLLDALQSRTSASRGLSEKAATAQAAAENAAAEKEAEKAAAERAAAEKAAAEKAAAEKAAAEKAAAERAAAERAAAEKATAEKAAAEKAAAEKAAAEKAAAEKAAAEKAAARPSAAALANFCRKVGIRDEQSVRQATSLDWTSKQLNSDDCQVIAYLIASGALANLTILYLRFNQIGDEGIKTFSAALASGALANLTILGLNGNQIGDAGIKIFSETVASGALANLTTLGLSRNQIGDAGIKIFSETVASGALANLTILDLRSNQIGDEGIKAFSSALASGALANLTVLDLGGNQIGVAGIKIFAETVASGALANLTILDLQSNKIGDAGMKIFSETVASGALAKLTVFYIDGKHMKNPHLVAACKPRGINITK